ncbi:hypothetical protein AB0B89_23780 [Sphaerisporangium sp. NPDC049002]|uniref:hypothetical protein n=1 Tax=Sphaerisporangium sp. NPDC049002 TaxID=3155392 RepID=UPI0033C42315
MGIVKDVLAVIGGLSVTASAFIIALAVAHHRADRARTRASRDAQIAQYIREGSPAALAADGPAWDRYMERQGVDLKAPKGWGR